MDQDAEALAQAIGLRVRSERQGRGWTLDDLAAAAGVSRRALVNVEQGAVNPSVGMLLRLGDALGLALPALVDLPRRTSPTVTRAGAGAVLWSGEHGGRGVLLAATPPPTVVELWEWTMQPGEQHDSEAHSTGTRELLHVHEGTVRLVVDDEVHLLAAGDASAFSGDVPHTYAADGDAATRFSLTVYEPAAGTRSKEVRAGA